MCVYIMQSYMHSVNVHYVKSPVWQCQRSRTWPVFGLDVTILHLKYTCAKFHQSTSTWVTVKNGRTDRRMDIQADPIKHPCGILNKQNSRPKTTSWQSKGNGGERIRFKKMRLWKKQFWMLSSFFSLPFSLYFYFLCKQSFFTFSLSLFPDTGFQSIRLLRLEISLGCIFPLSLSLSTFSPIVLSHFPSPILE